ncbi:hypothetical protein [Nonomuraea sp. 10N515B]|uniref:hypothetical protein n=1 Tax=Nonomuraea sp. 10N515B TaxID=3457422 RepID=UPI003FCDFFF6
MSESQHPVASAPAPAGGPVGPLGVVSAAYVRAGLRMGAHAILWSVLATLAVVGCLYAVADGEVWVAVLWAVPAAPVAFVSVKLFRQVVPHLLPHRSRLVRELAAGGGPEMRFTRQQHFEGGFTNDYTVTFADGGADTIRAGLGQADALEQALRTLGARP